MTNYNNANMWRGVFMGGLDVNDLSNQTIWNMYPYMSGIRKSEIGDEPGAIIRVEEDEEEDFIQRLERLDRLDTNVMHWNTTDRNYEINMEQTYDSDSETVVLEYE
jgi:hypothetical protein